MKKVYISLAIVHIEIKEYKKIKLNSDLFKSLFVYSNYN
jgi:hypothetical protein